MREGDECPQGGKPGWAAPPNPRIGPWLKLLKRIAETHKLTPEFEVKCALCSVYGSTNNTFFLSVFILVTLL